MSHVHGFVQKLSDVCLLKQVLSVSVIWWMKSVVTQMKFGADQTKHVCKETKFVITFLTVQERKMRFSVQASFVALHFDVYKNLCFHKYSFKLKNTAFVSGGFHTRPGEVLVDSEDTQGNNNCSLQVENLACSNLASALNSIIANKLFWIESIHTAVSKPFSSAHFVVENSKLDRAGFLAVVCVTHCMFTNLFSFSFQVHTHLFLFKFINSKFQDAFINLSNLDIIFENVSFVNCTIKSNPQIWSSNNRQLNISFVEASFVQSLLNVNTNQGGDRAILSVNIHLVDCKVHESFVAIHSDYLWFEAEDTVISSSSINLKAHVLQHTHLHSVKFLNQHKQNSFVGDTASLALVLTSRILFVDLEGVAVVNTSGLLITTLYAGLLPSQLQVKIQDSQFINNRKTSQGAAISVGMNTPYIQSNNSIVLTNLSFIKNKAVGRDYEQPEGGAISVVSHEHVPLRDEGSRDSSKLQLFLVECRFVDNFAQGGGGAVSVTGSQIRVKISQCYFGLDNAEFVSPVAIFLLVSSEISIERSIFAFKLQTVKVLLRLRMASSKEQISHLNFTQECAPWFLLSAETEFKQRHRDGLMVLQKYISQCKPCLPSFYYQTNGVFEVMYHSNMTEIVTHHQNMANVATCTECPYGGDCTGIGLKSKPNFWGFIQSGKITFLQCPLSYCCGGSRVSPCFNYNSCSGNRYDILCGRCLPGHSLSMLSENCMLNSKCSFPAFWFLCCVAVSAYMLWYTFKDHILSSLLKFWQKFSHSNNVLKMNDARSDLESEDKGYFGIVTYFVQTMAIMRLNITVDTVLSGTKELKLVESYVGILLNFELSYFSKDLCPFEGLDTTMKVVFKFSFLTGIFVSWLALFCPVFVFQNWYQVKNSWKTSLNTLELRAVKGLLEIVKYTFAGYAGVIFMSLSCVTVGKKTVWWYDGTISCFSNWNILMAVLCVTHVFPFPALFHLGMQELGSKRISNSHFLCSFFCPLVFVTVWSIQGCFGSCVKRVHVSENQRTLLDRNTVNRPRVTGEIVKALQGPYTTRCQSWESVLITRRLLVGITILTPNTVIQLGMSSALCTMFLMHHVYKQPFVHPISNRVESLSLTMLCVVASMNLFKAFFIDTGSVPKGLNGSIVASVQLIESLCLLFQLLFVLVSEVGGRYRKR